MKRMSVVYRHLAWVIELSAVDDDFCLQLCSEARPGMKRRHFIYAAIICSSDIRRHLIRIRVLAAVEPDIRLGSRAH